MGKWFSRLLVQVTGFESRFVECRPEPVEFFLSPWGRNWMGGGDGNNETVRRLESPGAVDIYPSFLKKTGSVFLVIRISRVRLNSIACCIRWSSINGWGSYTRSLLTDADREQLASVMVVWNTNPASKEWSSSKPESGLMVRATRDDQ